MGEHNKLLLAFMGISVAVMIITFAFNGLSNGVKPLFPYSTTYLSAKYPTGITPAGWTFSIWGFIYTWQVLWVGFAIVNIFRKTPEGRAYIHPMILPPVLFAVYTLNLGFNISWIFLFGYEHIELAFVALFLIAFTLYVCMFISHKNLYQYAPFLLKEKRNVEIWLHRILVHNGLGIYGTWTSIATLLNMVMVIVYRSSSGINLEDAGTIALGFLAAEITVFVIADLVFLDKYTRYTVTPYIVVVVALFGSINKNWNAEQRNSIFTAVLLGFGGLLLVVKIIVMLYRHFKKPMYPMVIASTIDGVRA